MTKRLLVSLFAVATTLSSMSAFAVAPTIFDLPSVQIGDAEDNVGTDNNLFQFTNAFKLDDFVSDSDSTISQLKWSFDEPDQTAPLSGQVIWFTVNGKAAELNGSAAIAAEESNGGVNHINPIRELRSVSAFASFRDIVFSFGPPDTLPYASPTGNPKIAHAAGKVVRFYVSDGTNVSSKDTLVTTVDNAFDAISGGFTFKISSNDGFTTDISNTNSAGPGWFYSSSGGTNAGAYDAANTALRINQTATGNANQFNVSGWTTTLSDWLPYATVGSTNVVRGKFWVFASGQSPNTANIVPDLRLKLQNASAVACELEVLARNATALEDTRGAELQPSSNASLPSLYRLDYDPIDVPYLASNGATQGFGGITRTFEAYNIGFPAVNGNLSLAQSVIGVYPAAYIADGLALTDQPYRTYVTGPTGLQNFNGTDYSAYKVSGGSGNTLGSVLSTPPIPTVTYNGSTGVTLDSSALADSTDIYVASADFSPIPKAGANWVTSDYQGAVKVDVNQQYKIRFHLVSSRASNLQSQIRVRARSDRFAWAVKQEYGGAYPTNSAINTSIAAQTLPGINCLNPDTGTLPGGTDGGWYTAILHTPLSADIRPDVAGPITTKMPFLSSCPGPGVGNTAGTANENIRRMIFFGMDIVDSFSSGANKNLEGGNVTCDQVEIRTYNLLPD